MNIPALFEHDRQLVNQLLDVLSREQTSLVEGDIDTMEALLDEKAELLQKISASVQQRYQALSQLGWEPSENGMAAWIKGHGHHKDVEAWHAFQYILSKSKEMNRLNGQLINKHFNRNQQFLQQLQGAGVAAASTYGPSGQANTASAYTRTALSV